METLKDLIRSNPAACFVVCFVATIAYGLAKLAAALPTL